jgi:hypothetical protein
MIRLEGATLPAGSQGAVPPILLGELLRDVPGIPLQVGYQATLADGCGITATGGALALSGADVVTTLDAVKSSGVVQIDQEWLYYTGKRTTPPGLWIGTRGYGGTTPATHGKGAAVYFVETRPIYAFAFVPEGCMYPANALVELRVNDNANTPPATVRLQDDRIVPGVRLVTVEFDAGKAFATTDAVRMPASLGIVARRGAAAVTASSGAASVSAAVPASLPMILRAAPASSGKGRLWDMRGTANLPPPPAAPAPSSSRAVSPVAAPQATPAVATVHLTQSVLGTVTADLRGLLDTAAGRYTGVARAPLRTPAHIVRLLLAETYGQTDPGRFHEPTWIETAARQIARGLTWRLTWTGEAFETFREAAQIGGQADLYLDEEGRWRYAFRDPIAPAVATITERELLGDPGIGWTAGRDLITVLEVAWGAGLDGGAFSLDSPAMRDRHGENHGALAIPYAASESVARLLARDQLSRRDRPRQVTTITAAHCFLPLTLRDRVIVETPLLQLYGARRVPFDVVGVTDRGDTRVLTLLESDRTGLGLALSGTLAVGDLTSVALSGSIVLGARFLSLSGTLAVGELLAGAVTGTAAIAGALSLAAPALLAGACASSAAVAGSLTTAAGGGTAPIPGALGWNDTTNTSSPVTFSYTTATGETYLLVRVSLAGTDAYVAGVTFGATALAKLLAVNSSDARVRVEVWGGVVPASTTATVTVTFATTGFNRNATVVGEAYAGVASVGTPKSSIQSAGTTSSITFDAGDVGAASLVVDVVGGSASDATGTPSGTLDYGGFADAAFQTKQRGSHAVNTATLSWSGLNHGNSDTVQVGVPLKG